MQIQSSAMAIPRRAVDRFIKFTSACWFGPKRSCFPDITCTSFEVDEKIVHDEYSTTKTICT